jgi:hypothetical protein
MSDQIAEFGADRDAFGHMLLDQFNGQETIEIIEREDGFIAPSAECRRYFSEYPDWHPAEQEAMRWLAPGRVLDLRERGRMAGQIRMRVRYLVHRSDWFDYLMVSRDEMRSIVEGTGWRVVSFLDDSSGSRYAGILEKERTPAPRPR